MLGFVFVCPFFLSEIFCIFDAHSRIKNLIADELTTY